MWGKGAENLFVLEEHYAIKFAPIHILIDQFYPEFYKEWFPKKSEVEMTLNKITNGIL